jgi:energy-coupling factor transporter ATP-binding protein EcfA2
MIEVREVAVEIQGLPAPVLEGVSFALGPGERAALLGGNGCGKTTLARLLNGTRLPTRGHVLVDGLDTRDTRSLVAIRRAVGLLFQDPDDQFVTTTVEREIAFGLENLRLPNPELRRAVDAALRDFDLEPHRQTPPHEMSGGEKARLALACVWVMRPRYLVLDETESLLDRRGRERLAAALAGLPSETAILHVTTDAEVASRCPRVLALHAGRLIADGTPDDVLASLPAAVIDRTGVPLAWRVASRLVAAGRLVRPTASSDRLIEALAGAARAAPLPNMPEAQ